MNRIEIKEEAKEKIRGNLWNFWKPFLVIYAISFCVGLVSGLFGDGPVGAIITLLAEIALMPLSVGALYYVLNLVRGKAFSINDLYKFYSNIWTIVGVTLLTGLIIFGGTLLFIVPGIILSYMYIMTNYILADGEKGVMETLRKSKKMMTGYKMDYFVFSLSFIGWILLVGVTFGIAAIYVVPYMNASMAIYYDRLKNLNEKGNKKK